MNEEIKNMLVDALRSGEYDQGVGYLCSDGKFCCQGVLTDLYIKHGGGGGGAQVKWVDVGSGILRAVNKLNNHSSTHYLLEAVKDWSGLDAEAEVHINGTLQTLPRHNDGGATFAQIADAIEEQL